MNPVIRPAVVVTLLLSGALPAAAQAPDPASRLLKEAATHAQQLEQTHYKHEKEASGASVLKLPDGKLRIDSDCSGWVSYNLMHSQLDAPWYKAIQDYQPNIPSEKGAPYPRANVYQGYFASLSTAPGTAPFVRVPSLAAVQPGDILSWCLGSHCQKPTSQDKARDTGHVMIVISPPIKNDDTSAFLMVLDSSSVTHWSFDTLPVAVKQTHPNLSAQYAQFPQVRTQTVNGKLQTSGVGAGFILFQTDPSGAITGFQFDPNGTMHTVQTGIQFAVGRLVSPTSK